MNVNVNVIETRKFNKLARLTILLSVLYILCLSTLSINSIKDYFDWLSYNPYSFVYGSSYFILRWGLILPGILFYCSAVFAVAAVIIGIISLQQIKKTNEKGRIISLIVTTINIFFVIYFFFLLIYSAWYSYVWHQVSNIFIVFHSIVHIWADRLVCGQCERII